MKQLPFDSVELEWYTKQRRSDVPKPAKRTFSETETGANADFPVNGWAYVERASLGPEYCIIYVLGLDISYNSSLFLSPFSPPSPPSGTSTSNTARFHRLIGGFPLPLTSTKTCMAMHATFIPFILASGGVSS